MAARIGVLSDTHLNDTSIEFRRLFERYLAGTDMILHAGDVVSLSFLKFFDGLKFYGVQGNMDSTEVKRILPGERILEISGYKVGLIHGWGPPDGIEERISREMSGVDIIIYGHSHIPASHYRDGVFFFNPGTATGYSFEGYHSVGILELGDKISGEIVGV